MSALPPPEPGSFPIFLNLSGRRVLVVGSGDEAAAKARLLTQAGAVVRVVAEVPYNSVAALSLEIPEVAIVMRPFRAQDLEGATLCIVALDDEAAAAAVVAAARAAGVLVNAVDRPALCDFTVPAIVQRAPITVAIGTDGAAPALARDLRGRVEAAVPPGYAALAGLCRTWRDRVAAALPDRLARRRFWDTVLAGAEATLALDGNIVAAGQHLSERLGGARADATARSVGRVSLVGAGPGDPELLTLRALRALKRADVVLHDALIDPATLDLARRDARRIDVGKRCGHHAMPQAEINRLLVEHARRGLHVVRLKGGDPFVFGRGGEELDCLREAGIAVEVIPGITAACAAAAQLGIPLTHRALARRVHIITGHGSDGALPECNWSALAAGDATIAAYMAGGNLNALAARLIAAGVPASMPAVAVENASRRGGRHLFGTIASLPATLASAKFDGPTVVLIGCTIRDAMETRTIPALHMSRGRHDTEIQDETAISVLDRWCGEG